MQNVNLIFLNAKLEKCISVVKITGIRADPAQHAFKQTLLEVRLSRPCMKNFNRTLLKKISAPPQPLHDQCEPIISPCVFFFISVC